MFYIICVMKIKELFKNKYVSFIFQAILTALGAFIMSVGFKSFYIPNKITPGGFSGLSTIFSDLIFDGTGTYISPSIFYIIFNIALFGIALYAFGFRFTFLTLIGTLCYSIFMEYNPVPAFNTKDLILAAIIGGAIYGIGCGFVFRLGSSTGGSDIVALSLNKKYPKIKPGQCNLIINAIVLTLSVIVYKNLELALYTIIAVFASSMVTDKILNGIKTVRAVYVICTKDVEISNEIMRRFNQGVTRVDAEGMYSQQERKILLCLVSTYQAPFIKNIVTAIEPNAMIFSTSVNEAVGEKAFLKAKKQGLKLDAEKLSQLIKHKPKKQSTKKHEIAKAKPTIKSYSKVARHQRESKTVQMQDEKY